MDAEKIRAIAEELLPKDRSPVPSADFGPEEGPLPYLLSGGRPCPSPLLSFLSAQSFVPPRPGEAALKQHLVSQLALRLLAGSFLSLLYRVYGKGPSKPGF